MPSLERIFNKRKAAKVAAPKSWLGVTVIPISIGLIPLKGIANTINKKPFHGFCKITSPTTVHIQQIYNIIISLKGFGNRNLLYL